MQSYANRDRLKEDDVACVVLHEEGQRYASTLLREAAAPGAGGHPLSVENARQS